MADDRATHAPPAAWPTCSVVIAAYDAAATIGEAVGSALEQQPPPLEVVVCDDGSTDDLAGALRPFGDAVRLVRTDHGGEAAAKNAAIGAARGELVAILDADDRFLPGRLAATVGVLAERGDVDVVTTDAHLELDGRRVGRCYHEEFRFAVSGQRAAILDHNFVFGHVVARRAAVLAAGGFDESIGYTTDWELWIRMVLAGSVIALVDEPLAVYRMHESAMSASRARMYAGRIATLRKTATDPRLTDSERVAVRLRIDEETARLAREEARAALVSGAPDARSRAWRVARDAHQPGRARLVHGAAATLPPVAAAILRARDRRTFVGVGGHRYPRPR